MNQPFDDGDIDYLVGQQPAVGDWKALVRKGIQRRDRRRRAAAAMAFATAAIVGVIGADVGLGSPSSAPPGIVTQVTGTPSPLPTPTGPRPTPSASGEVLPDVLPGAGQTAAPASRGTSLESLPRPSGTTSLPPSPVRASATPEAVHRDGHAGQTLTMAEISYPRTMVVGKTYTFSALVHWTASQPSLVGYDGNSYYPHSYPGCPDAASPVQPSPYTAPHGGSGRLTVTYTPMSNFDESLDLTAEPCRGYWLGSSQTVTLYFRVVPPSGPSPTPSPQPTPKPSPSTSPTPAVEPS